MSKKKDEVMALLAGNKSIFQMNGSEIITEAMQKMKQQYKERIITFTHATMETIQTLENNKRMLESQIGFQRRRLAAIAKDEFTINNQGQIVFNQGDLNG